MDIYKINCRLDKMIRNCKYEKENVINEMNTLNKKNIFY